jgi:glyoxylase-like metal-dependent hydrolase (beta-lactamase superfamily II)
MGFAIASRWFEFRRIDDDITLIWEPHVVRLLQCNIWHVRGRDHDLLVDAGLGMASLREAARDLLQRLPLALATHSHLDHTGGLHEFPDRIAHRAEADKIGQGSVQASLFVDDPNDPVVAGIRASGYETPPELFTAIPNERYDPRAYAVKPAPIKRIVEEGDVVDLGDRRFEVLHLPGHSPGGIGLWEQETGILFSGDAVYDGPLLDELPESDIGAYVATMKRLRDLPVNVVHAGHDPSFGRDRLRELCDAYMARRA